MALDSYNSTYPTEYYEIGECYAFFTVTNSSKRDATEQEIKQYSSKLRKCISENKGMLSGNYVGIKPPYARIVGIVIDKEPLTASESRKYKGFLTVMFHSIEDDTYVVQKYVYGSAPVYDSLEKGVFFDNDESFIPFAQLKSGPTGVIEPGPFRVKEAGPTIVKETGPTVVKEAGPTVVKEAGPTAVH